MQRDERLRRIEKQKLRAGNFVRNNGRVLTTINILRYQYTKLSSISSLLEEEGIEADEFLDSVNFLTEEKYITLRNIKTHEEATLADESYELLEAKLTGRGIRLLAAGITDNMIEV